MQDKYFALTVITLVKMLGGHLQQLSKISLDIQKLLTITTFVQFFRKIRMQYECEGSFSS